MLAHIGESMTAHLESNNTSIKNLKHTTSTHKLLCNIPRRIEMRIAFRHAKRHFITRMLTIEEGKFTMQFRKTKTKSIVPHCERWVEIRLWEIDAFHANRRDKQPSRHLDLRHSLKRYLFGTILKKLILLSSIWNEAKKNLIVAWTWETFEIR